VLASVGRSGPGRETRALEAAVQETAAAAGPSALLPGTRRTKSWRAGVAVLDVAT
jgi:hypothetical protein